MLSLHCPPHDEVYDLNDFYVCGAPCSDKLLNRLTDKLKKQERYVSFSKKCVFMSDRALNDVYTNCNESTIREIESLMTGTTSDSRLARNTVSKWKLVMRMHNDDAIYNYVFWMTCDFEKYIPLIRKFCRYLVQYRKNDKNNDHSLYGTDGTVSSDRNFPYPTTAARRLNKGDLYFMRKILKKETFAGPLNTRDFTSYEDEVYDSVWWYFIGQQTDQTLL